MASRRKKTFIASPFLVTIDGPDGAGKSTFSEILTKALQKRNGSRSVKLIRPTRFDASPRARAIGEELKAKSGKIACNSKRHNDFFLRTAETNYRGLILPAIREKQLVIVDSSEMRALAFILERGAISAKTDTADRLGSGMLTCGVKPSKRIILHGIPSDLFRNLATRTSLDIGDPRNIAQIRKRIAVYVEAIRIIRGLEGDDGVEWIFIQIEHTQQPLAAYFWEIIEKHNLIRRLSPRKSTLL